MPHRSEYEKDFYVKENIVAYTGDLTSNPTVYFKQIMDDGNIKFGHITQTHRRDKINIGREEIEADPTYTLENEHLDGDYISVERVKGKIVHPSRTPHEKVGPNDDLIRDELATCIDRHKGLKKLYTRDYIQEQIDFIKQEPKIEDQIDQLTDLKEELEGIIDQYVETYPEHTNDILQMGKDLQEQIGKEYFPLVRERNAQNELLAETNDSKKEKKPSKSKETKKKRKLSFSAFSRAKNKDQKPKEKPKNKKKSKNNKANNNNQSNNSSKKKKRKRSFSFNR